MNSPVLALPWRVLYAVRHSFPFAPPWPNFAAAAKTPYYFLKGQPDSLAAQIRHILTTHAEPPTRCFDLEQLTWKKMWLFRVLCGLTGSASLWAGAAEGAWAGFAGFVGEWVRLKIGCDALPENSGYSPARILG